jgi:hypothetical protein
MKSNFPIAIVIVAIAIGISPAAKPCSRPLPEGGV